MAALQALLCLLLLQHSKSEMACENLQCFADYVQTLTCIWDAGTPGGKLPNLTATWECGHHVRTCDFLPTSRNASHLRYACSSEQKLCGTFSKTFAVEAVLVDGAVAVCQSCGPFHYHEHVKPQPPFSVTAQACPGGYNVSWQSGYSAYDYMHGELQYQLRYRQKGHPWSTQGGGMAGELAGGTDYELQVRAGPRGGSLYKGTWSDWSASSSLRTPPRGTGGAAWLLTPLLALSLLVSLLAFLGRQQHRPWKKLDQFIPSPAPFFQTLYLAHNGDFKKWVGTSFSGAPVDIYEGGTAVLEGFHISPKPLRITAASEETSAPPFTATLLAFPGESPESGLEPACSRLSISTVTVADACGLEMEAYRCLPLDLSPAEGQVPPPSPPWHSDACLEHRSPFSAGLLGTSSPPPGKPFCRELLFPPWAADGDVAEPSLDLDTVDSGFVDSDCGSPVDCGCQGRCASCAAPSEDEAALLPSYVKQWAACHTPPEELR